MSIIFNLASWQAAIIETTVQSKNSNVYENNRKLYKKRTPETFNKMEIHASNLIKYSYTHTHILFYMRIYVFTYTRFKAREKKNAHLRFIH